MPSLKDTDLGPHLVKPKLVTRNAYEFEFTPNGRYLRVEEYPEGKAPIHRFIDTCSESADIRVDATLSLMGVLDETAGALLFIRFAETGAGTLAKQPTWGSALDPIAEIPECSHLLPYPVSPDGRWWIAGMGDEASTLLVVDLVNRDLRRFKGPGPYAHFARWANDGTTMHALFRLGDHPGVGTYKTSTDTRTEHLAKVFDVDISRKPYQTFELDLATGEHWEVPHHRLVHQQSPDGSATMNLVKAELHVTRGDKLTRIGLSDHQRYLLEIGALSWINDRYMYLKGDENYRHCFVDSTNGRKNIVIRRGDHGAIKFSALFKKAAFTRNSALYLADIANDDE